MDKTAKRMSTGSLVQSNEAQSGEELTDSTVIVVCGASGDLAKKKTYPALFNLYRTHLLPKNIRIIGYARSKLDEDAFKDRVTGHLKSDDKKLVEEFYKLNTYQPGAYDEESAFQALNEKIEKVEKEIKGSHRVFYMALPPSVFIPVAEGLKKSCYSKSGVNRIIIEKPFGKDLESCRELLSSIKKHWTEEETFRIDHYLGKEMVKNLMVLRFANPLISAYFHRDYVSSVQLTFKEPFGTEGRGGYFDEFGIIRDVMQNHLVQILSIVTMEKPKSFGAEDIRSEKVKVLKAIPPISTKDFVTGQYTKTGDKPGYLDDETVPKGSVCPTFAAFALEINNDRWKGVPFIMRAGKALNQGKVEVRIQLKDGGQGIFENITRNELVIRIQPDESVYQKINVKLPGLEMKTLPTELDLTYKDRFQEMHVPEAYETLILSAMRGQHSEFVRDDELEEAWRIFTPLLHHIEKAKPKPESYPYGTRGPESMTKWITDHGYVYEDSEAYTWPKTNLNKL